MKTDLNDVWDFKVAGYRAGKLLLETVHKGPASMEMEVAAWERRAAGGECDVIIIADMRPKWRRELDAGRWAADLTRTIHVGGLHRRSSPQRAWR